MLTSQFVFNHGAWSQVLPQELDSAQTLLIVSARSQVSAQEVLEGLRRTFPSSVIIGCSSAGSICGQAILDQEVTVTLVQFAKTQLRSCQESIDQSRDSFEVGHRVAKGLTPPLNGQPLQHIFVFAEGLEINGTQLLKGIQQAFSETSCAATISGGLAADGADFTHTWTVLGSTVSSKRVVAVGCYGSNLNIGLGSAGGWDRFGPQRTITKSSGNFLQEIDGQPALELYRAYLGPELTKNLPGSAILFPLGLEIDGQSDLVRTVLGVDLASSSMIFAGDIPLNSKVHIMRPRFSKLIAAAEQAAKEASAKLDANIPSLCLAVSCVGRRMVLGERAEDELESLSHHLPRDCAILGFYANGEINYVGSDQCQLMNQTMSVTIVQEKP